MNVIRRLMVFGCLSAAGVMIQSQVLAEDEEIEADPLPGPVIVLFDDGIGGLGRQQFGVFRDDDSPRDQFIEEKLMAFKIDGHEEPVGFLVLPYNVSASGSYNGWWLKLGRADWSKYKKGDLVLRLRRLDPESDKYERSIDLGMKDTPCARSIKVELKTKNESGRIRSIGLRKHIRDKEIAEQKTKGYFDLRIPVEDFVLNLDSCHELVLVFENRAFLPTEYCGALGIRGVALTTEPGQNVDELLRRKGE